MSSEPSRVIHFDPPRGRPLGVTPVYKVIGFFLKPLLSLIVKKDWRGEEFIPATGAAIVVSNHISYLDPFTLTHFLYNNGRAPRYLGKKGVFDTPIVGWVVRAAGQIPVERESTGASKAFGVAIAALRAGHLIGIYPEGTLTRDENLWPMTGKTGAARLALMTGVPVIPCASWGPQEVIPRYGRKIKLFPRTRVSILAGPPIDLSPWKGRESDPKALEEATNHIMDEMTDLLSQLRGEAPPAVRFDAKHSELPRTGNFLKSKRKKSS
jgi:1-acyl-sn-glycerol-3-phosphate acyltransferase